jgi:hypothetical protein
MSLYLDYPINLGHITKGKAGQHYVLIESKKSRNAVDSGTTTLSSIALYIPPGSLKTSHTQNYQGLEGGALKASAAAGIENLFAGGGVSLDGIIGGAKGSAQAVGAKLANKGDFLAAGMGLATNSHTALVYRGPGEFRTHDFTFNFFPKNKTEADRVRAILQEFEKGMLPIVNGKQINSRRLSSPFFKSPRHYTIKFCNGKKTKNDYLFDIKTSVITSMSVNHEAQSMVSFHSDGSPVQTQLTLQFKEIEYVVSSDSPSKETQREMEAIEQQATSAVYEDSLGGSTINPTGGGVRE